MLLRHLTQGPLVLVVVASLSACEREVVPYSASVERSVKSSKLQLLVDRSTVAFLANHGLEPMIGTGPCGKDEAPVWYVADVIGTNGRKWPSAHQALSHDAGQRFTLSAIMDYPRPGDTNDCAYLTSVGYSLFELRAKSVPLSKDTK